MAPAQPPASSRPDAPARRLADGPAVRRVPDAAVFRASPPYTAIILAAIDQTIVATALPAIAGSLGAVGADLLGRRRLADRGDHRRPGLRPARRRVGRKRLLLVALGIQAAGALVSATAPSFAVLIGGRLLQGFGGGGLATLSMALIAEAVPPRERGRFQAYIVASFTTASLLGPLRAAGWPGFGWRGVFWVMLP